MVAAMLLFALEDMCIKLLSQGLPVGQVLLTVGVMGFAIFWTRLRMQGGRLLTRDLLQKHVIIRSFGELIGTMGFVTALALTEISSASAILQALPLAITLGAAIFLGESVGWRRWLAIGAGFVGVLFVVKPGLSGFDANSLWAVLGVIGLGTRDLATRRVPRHIPSDQLSSLAWLTLIPAGLLLDVLFNSVPVLPDLAEMGLFLAAILFGVVAYTMLVTATREGDASVIAPFRYSRLVFAMLIGVVVFAERPDALTLLGAAIIAGAGGFSMWREARLRRRASRA